MHYESIKKKKLPFMHITMHYLSLNSDYAKIRNEKYIHLLNVNLNYFKKIKNFFFVFINH